MKRFFAYAMLCAAASGQTQSAAPAGDVTGPGNFIHLVSNADKSQAFYHDVIGLDLSGGPASAAPRPSNTRPEVMRLYNTVGAQFRSGGAMIKESPMRAELIEFQNVERKPVQPRFVDPGAANFILTVRDIGEVMERVKKSGTPVVTTGGEPVTIKGDRGSIRAVVLKDPDGFYVELLQPATLPENAAQSSNNVIATGFGFTVENTEPMVRIFNSALGFALQTGKFKSDKAWLKLFGAPAGSKFRRATATIPGSSVHIEFIQFQRADGKPVHSAPRDTGSAVLRLRIRDMDATVKSLAANGVKVVSVGGEPVPLGNERYAITSFPDNLFVQVVGPGAPRVP